MNLCDIENLNEVTVRREDEISRRVELCFKDPDREVSSLHFSFVIQETSFEPTETEMTTFIPCVNIFYLFLLLFQTAVCPLFRREKSVHYVT